MVIREQVPRRHSPAVWGLLAVLGAFTAAVAAWNLYERRADIRSWLKL